VAWQQIMPVRNHPAGKEFAGAWVVPTSTYRVAARLIMDQADLEDPTLQIVIQIFNVTTGLNVIQSTWNGGFLTKKGTYDPPNFSYRMINGDGSPLDLGGQTWDFSINANRAVRYGAEIDLG